MLDMPVGSLCDGADELLPLARVGVLVPSTGRGGSSLNPNNQITNDESEIRAPRALAPFALACVCPRTVPSVCQFTT
eukprot:787056-Prymnesium_polylepis.1